MRRLYMLSQYFVIPPSAELSVQRQRLCQNAILFCNLLIDNDLKFFNAKYHENITIIFHDISGIS